MPGHFLSIHLLLSKFLTQEHDDLIKGLLLLREYYKTEYKKALQDKIEKQKKTFQQRQAYLEEEAKLSQELEVMCRLFYRDCLQFYVFSH